ncbi:MAG: hypothetical protein IJF27_09190 [Oscillospiraceae bacterium]|nr:hypothetical protein [Oscillospiraceae bacterium]
MLTKDAAVVQELAKKYMELALSEKQLASNKRMKDSNDLKIVRPPVLIDEIPWHEFDDAELKCVCEDPRAAALEAMMRRAIYKKEHFNSDVLMPAYHIVSSCYTRSPLGVSRQEIHAESGANRTTRCAHIFKDVLEDESSVELINPPSFALHPEKDEEYVNYYTELLGDTMPVKFVGHGYFGYAFWDDISFLRGVEPIYEDLYDRPEHLHRIMQKLVERAAAEMDFVEANLSVHNETFNLHCTPGMISGVADDGLKATWFRGTAQPFSCVSPAMFKEFELDYIKPLAERCAYTYYGCCEPLDDRIEMLKTISNLRKLGVSPWAKIETCAEQIGKDFVFARKPNPAHVASSTDPDVIRKETEETVKACIKYGCPCEFVLKDITTVSGNPENLVIWADTVNSVLDEYYGR